MVSVIKAYDVMADQLIGRYESLTFEQVHQDLLPWLPIKPAKILDVGSGSGRDSKKLAELGYDVVSVEPAENMIGWAKRHNNHKRISWIQDSLPKLRKVKERHQRFDLILLSAVMMHIPPVEREESFETLCELLKGKGLLYFSTSNRVVGDLRKFYEVSAEELNVIAKNFSLDCLEQKECLDRFNRNNASWTVSIFRKKCP